MLEEENIEDLTILGPTVPYIKKQGNMFVEQLLLKYKKAEKIEISEKDAKAELNA